MNQQLQRLCELQIENEKIVRKAAILEMEELAKMGALFYTAKGRQADPERIKECKAILKRKTGIFSNFRGYLQYAVQVKMSLETDPEAWLDSVMGIYKKLVEGRALPGEILAMTAITIYEQGRGKDIDQVIAQTKEAYASIKKTHKFLTDESDMSFIALMVLCGKDVNKTVAEVEELYLALKDRFRMPSDTAQAAALVLSMSEKPTAQKAEDFIGLYEALKAEKHATSKGKPMSIYAAFADANIPRDEAVAEIGEVEAWLKGQKGYGFLSEPDIRRVMAATLVLQRHEAASADPVGAGVASVVTQVIAEEVILTIIMLLVITITASSAHH